MNLNFADNLVPYIPFILQGLWVTLGVVIVAALIGFILAIILALFKIGRIKALQWFADAYTSVFRGTPLILQLFIIYFGLPQLLGGVDIPAYVAAVSAFALNSGAYMSEVIRAGIQAVDKGQREAAMALGVPYKEMMWDIVMPQAFKNILPALMNEFITLTKESALVSVIGTMDLMRRAQIIGGKTYAFFEPLLFVGLVYYLLVIFLTFVGKMIERRLKQSD